MLETSRVPDSELYPVPADFAARAHMDRQAYEAARVAARDQVAGQRPKDGAADPEERDGGGRGAAGAAELGEEGGEEDREGVAEPGVFYRDFETPTQLFPDRR